jgi:hypothetical protein
MFGRLFQLFAAVGFATASVKDCSNGASVFQLTDLSLTPSTPVRGQNLDMTVIFNNPGTEITDGTVTTTVTLNFIPFQPTVEALCTNTQCPLVSGTNDRSTYSVWPDNVSGSITSKIEWTALDGTQLLCIQINAKVAAPEGMRFRRQYNQTDANVLATALRLNAPLALEDVLPGSIGPFYTPICERSKELILWSNQTNALTAAAF